MDIVKTNGNRTAFSFPVHITAELLKELREDGTNFSNVLLWWDESDQEYVLSPVYNRVKMEIGELNLLKPK